MKRELTKLNDKMTGMEAKQDQMQVSKDCLKFWYLANFSTFSVSTIVLKNSQDGMKRELTKLNDKMTGMEGTQDPIQVSLYFW